MGSSFWINTFLLVTCELRVSLVLWLVFSFSSLSSKAEVTHFDDVSFIHLLFYGLCFFVVIFKKLLPNPRSQRFSSIFFSL